MAIQFLDGLPQGAFHFPIFMQGFVQKPETCAERLHQMQKSAQSPS
jgi:hypothetical protein